ncbi:hypothetical protein KDX38_09280 [Pseudomonas sp. CDFA 602]|uniref:hypothetical protein n=1 Tax=Pseudomonas californiensis TaxID=2829823 RepID=UPI001E4580F5|nr:hypothetical protein [Pseudomonas californiensis]MCD5993815.1 hypothetical protein [Pseudomonas californiensis]MCD5999410.1 hypothetical protein [Pseudomonas californiensis]
MTTINTSTLSAYSSSFSLSVTTKDAQAAAAANTTTDDKKTTEVSLEGATTNAASGGSAGGSSKSALDETIDRIKEQIKQTQKQLAQEQAQLAAVQNGSGTPEEKAQRAMSIQAQIVATNAALQTLQGSLLQLMNEGGVNTTA